jgi:hypothetical protein
MSAAAAKDSARSIQFQGTVRGFPARILLDSGSSHTFISTDLAAKLSGVTTFSPALRVSVADGSILYCSSQFQQLEWSVQGCDFVSEAKILPLTAYELILRMDWLSTHSPMQIDWSHKWLLITHADSPKMLHGTLSALPFGSVIQVTAMVPDAPVARQEQLPPEVATLLSEFDAVFAPPSGYPPERDCDHAIPLLPGATPFSIRPYRYPPAIKDEIERQIGEMLQSGIIRPSSSPFSSSVLLVKKKDGTFRFCVEFRQLNALTAKTKYPVPVIEELLDELTHASWFSCLDLTAGYHRGKSSKPPSKLTPGNMSF